MIQFQKGDQKDLDQRIQFKKQIYMNIASEFAKLSYCKRQKVGAIIVKENNIISFGYNGTPTGMDNCCEENQNKSKNIVLHAESNAITKCSKSTYSCKDSTLFITISPCIECAKLIIQAGIKKVIFKDYYRENDGNKLLFEAGIITEKLNVI